MPILNRRFTLSLLLLMGSSSVFAQTWVVVARSSEIAQFIDIDSIRKEGERVLSWVLTDQLNPMKSAGAYKSQVSLRVFDCKTGESAIRSYALYSGHVQSGDVLDSGNFKGKEQFAESPPGTIGRSLTKAACAWSARAARPADFDVLLVADETALRTLDGDVTANEDGTISAWATISLYTTANGAPEVLCRHVAYDVDCKRGLLKEDGSASTYADRGCGGKRSKDLTVVGGDWHKPSTWQGNLVAKACERAPKSLSAKPTKK